VFTGVTVGAAFVANSVFKKGAGGEFVKHADSPTSPKLDNKAKKTNGTSHKTKKCGIFYRQ